MTPWAYILAGGKSSRMGRDKALLDVGGLRSIERVRSAAGAVASRTFVVANDPARYAFLGCTVLPDPVPGLGPIGGLAAALGSCKAEWALVLGCDLPFLTPDCLRALVARADGCDVVVPRDAEGELQTVCAAYATTCLPQVSKLVAEGKRALHQLVARVRARVVAWEELRGLPGSELFFLAINDPESYARALRAAT